MSSIKRRKFIKQSVAATAAFTLPTAFYIKDANSADANDRIGIGQIGMGGRGGELYRSFKPHKDVQIVAMADPDASRVEDAADNAGCKDYKDLRKLLEDPNVDAVTVSTCNHWHCLAAIMAMQAGKDVYVEKPLSHTQWEGRQVVNAARKYKKIVQLGTQQRSDPLQTEAKKFLHDDKALGKILYVQANRLGVRESIGIRNAPLVIPEEVNYDLWLGPAQDEKLYRNALHYDWHWDFNTGNGEMGNWGVHVLDDVRNVAYQDAVITPKRILSVGGRAAWNDAGDTPNVHFVCFDTGLYPTMIALSNLNQAPDKKGSWKMPANRSFSGPGSGYVVACEGGYYLGQRGSGKAIDLNGKEIRSFKGGDRMKLHTRNFLDAVRAQDKSVLNAEIETGHDSTGWCNLANVAFQTGGDYSRAKAESIMPNLEAWSALLENMEESLAKFGVKADSDTMRMSPILTHDPKKEQFVGANAELANPHLKRQYRAGYAVPDLS
ncbi:MAG: Gfo/Idh/MocA family oxidoreductase [Candidatus Hinthialibacter antarcticus]|nr:Gfo/Idh/MocA family oxidoreductase [Candidatus Hinthialibacter antarcticus]